MQSWQVLPVILVIGVFAVSFAMRGKLRAKAAAMYSGAMDAFRAEVGAGRQPDEAEPIYLVATHRKMLSATIYYVAVTNRRFAMKPAGSPTQLFDRRAVQLAIKQKTFTDVGNMQTTISHGWELAVTVPDGTRQAWRVYDHADGIADHGAQVRALVAVLGA
jgi:hypothetical protein